MHFVDREELRSDIYRLAAERRSTPHGCAVLLHGITGIGASALASRVFDDHRDFFGTLIWIDTRQPTGDALPLGDMLRMVLRRCGVTAADQEPGLAGLLDEYTEIAAREPFLLVLDDVSDDRALGQFAVPGATVVATARHRLAGPISAGFTPFQLTALGAEQSLQLLQAHWGSTGTEIDPVIVTELAREADGIPFLLELIAGQLQGRPRAAASARARRLLADLRASTGAVTTLDADRRMAKWIDIAVAQLSPDRVRAYTVLAYLPGSFGAELAAIAIGCGIDWSARFLDELTDLNLGRQLDGETGRYACYSVVQADGQGRAAAGTGRQAIALAGHAMLEQAAVHDAALAGRWRVGPVFARLGAIDARTDDRDAALAWFDREWPNLVGYVRAAKSFQLFEIGYQLCVALFKYLHLNKLTDVWINVHNDGLDCARALGDPLAIAQLTNQRGAGYREVGNHAAAQRDFEESYAAAQAARAVLAPGSAALRLAVIAEQSALEWRGKTSAALGDPAAALDLYTLSEMVIANAGNDIDLTQRQRATASLGLQRARAHKQLEDYPSALSAIEPAAAFYLPRASDRDSAARCLCSWGETLLASGQAAVAGEKLARAAELRRADGAGREYALIAELQGDAARAAENPTAAIGHYRTAVTVLRRCASPLAGRVSDKLAALGVNDAG